MADLTRRDFIKTVSLATLAMAVPVEVFAATKTKADLVVYGKIFTSEDNKIVESFAVKDGKYVYVGEKAGAKAFIDKNKTEIIDYALYVGLCPLNSRNYVKYGRHTAKIHD